MIKIFNKNYLVLALFAVLIAVFYGNTLFNGFVLDDRKVVEENVYVHSLKYLPKVITGCIWEYTNGGCAGKTLHYRPVNSLSFLITYQISSQPWFFHLVNLVYFFSIVSLLFFFVRLVTRNTLLAFFTSLIFLVHPVNSEVVNWISAVPDLTVILFCLLNLIFYAQYRIGKESEKKRNLLCSIVFYFFAMLSKEIAVFIIPVLLVSLDLFLFRIKRRQLLMLQELKKYLLFGIPFVMYFFMRMAALGGLGGLTSKSDYLGEFSLVERVNAFFTLFAYSLKEILFPYPLSFLHDVPIGSNFFNLPFLFSFLITVLFFFLVYFFIKRGQRLFAFSFIWFFIFFSPILVFFNIAGERNHFFERYLFGSSIGFALFAGFVLAYLWQRQSKQTLRRKLLVGLLLGIFLGSSWIIVFRRNEVWADNITFLRATLQQKPYAVSIREFLAYELLTIKGDEEAAKAEYEKIVEQDPSYKGIDNAYSHLGDYYRKREQFEKAEEYYAKSIKAAGERNYKSYNNFGAFQEEQGQYLKALVNFCKALKIDQTAPEPQQNYSRIASMIQSVDDAQYIFLYQDVMQGGAFEASQERAIAFEKKSCAYGTCFYTFSARVSKGEALFPFLIMATAIPSEIIKIEKAEFNSSSQEIVLAIDSNYKDRLITFSFPSCSGARYETQVSE